MANEEYQEGLKIFFLDLLTLDWYLVGIDSIGLYWRHNR